MFNNAASTTGVIPSPMISKFVLTMGTYGFFWFASRLSYSFSPSSYALIPISAKITLIMDLIVSFSAVSSSFDRFKCCSSICNTVLYLTLLRMIWGKRRYSMSGTHFKNERTSLVIRSRSESDMLNNHENN